MEFRSVKLDGGQITYSSSTYGCDECGYLDESLDMFEYNEQEDTLLCSLHRKE